MKFVLASYGARGDVEPCATIGRELLRRGHEVSMAVPCDLVDFVQSAGLATVAYSLDTQAVTAAYVNLWQHFYFSRNLWKVRDVMRLRHEVGKIGLQCWQETATTLVSMADGADLLLTSGVLEQPAANVAEYYDIPLVTTHLYPMRSNGRLLRYIPARLGRRLMTARDWSVWRLTKYFEDAQRRELGLPNTRAPFANRAAKRGSLEIQAYDQVCFPGLATEWVKCGGRRPFVGALSMELPTDADEGVLSWIAAGTPPIFFGFGSMPLESPDDTLAMIGAVCERLGQRALVCAGASSFSCAPHIEHVKVVDAVNYAVVFPACRALVHHGSNGTTAAGLRAGVPALILWTIIDQAVYGAAVKRLKVGKARRFSTITEESLDADLRTVLTPPYLARAREVAARMTRSADSTATAADLVERFAQRSAASGPVRRNGRA